jgi:hypothetical protein
MADAISVLFRATVRTACVLAVVLGAAAAQDVGSAQITGRVVDTQGAPLPGVRITATRDLQRKEVITSSDGGFAISGLAPATYELKADLDGFETVNMTVPVSATGVGKPLTIRMRLGCFEPDLEVIPALVDTVNAADLIIRVRLDSIERAYQQRVDDGYCGTITVFEATIGELVVNRRSQSLGRIRFVMLGTEVDRFQPGNDYIAFLMWHSGTGTYRTFGRGYYLVPVRDGRVNLPGRIRGEGDQPLDEALAAVRALSLQR